MKPLLILIRPIRKETGERIDVRIGDAPAADYYGLDGYMWEPAVNQRPTTSIETMSLDLDGKVQTAKAKFALMLRQVLGTDAPDALYWKSAPVQIWSFPAPSWSERRLEFDGIVTRDTLDLDRITLALDCEVSSALIEKPLLTLTFDGGGGLGGDPEIRGNLKPTGFGEVFNIEPVWIDVVRNIGMIDGYHNTIETFWLGEALASFGDSMGDYATFDALAAAVDAHDIDPGRWATCNAEGLIALGAPPVGTITVHTRFGSGRCGAMMRRMLHTYLGIDADLIDDDSFNALDAELDYPAHYWTVEQRQVVDLLEAIAGSCNATPIISLQGLISVTRAVASAPIMTIDRSGSVEPRVTDWKTAANDAPYWQIKGRVARPARVMSFDEVNYVNDLVDRGLYDNDTVYRIGNVVWLPDGSQWLYISDTPDKGHAPINPPPVLPTPPDPYWQQLQPPQLASDITYVDGTPIEDLKPAEIGANPTETHVAAAIDGQGALATDDTVNEDTIDANSVTRAAFFTNDFNDWVLPNHDVWVDVDDGTFTAQISITAGSVTGQFVDVSLVMSLNRAGGADDDAQVRVRRDDGAILEPPFYEIAIQGQNFTYTFGFVDDDPLTGSTHSYTVQINSEALSKVNQVYLRGILFKR